MLKFIADESRWNRLRLFGNSIVVRSTMAVPVLGYLILFNAYLFDYLRLHSAFCRGAGCDVSWRLYFIYFGCCFVGLGAGIYAIFCPALIKRYPGASDFVESEKYYFSQPRNLSYLFRMIGREKGKPAADPAHLKTEFVDANMPLPESQINLLADIMGEHYQLQMFKHRSFRVATLISYSIGILLLIIPTLYTFAEVLFRASQRVLHLIQ
jgi:hypothetical protein